jgi:PAS domain S-box-containing protein
LQWLGYSRDEIVGKKTFPDLITERSRKTFQDIFSEFKARGWVRDLEFEMVREDGSILPVLLSATAVIDENGNYVMSRSTVYDISARIQAEKNLHRLNRELRAISDCNQTMLRAVDEQTLLNDICRIICDVAGYRMAWVGYAEHDDAKTIRPVAWAGIEDGYLSTVNITWADTERGHGPTGTAIRNGKSFCVQDFAIESRLSLWREHALQRGYRSSISLPLKNGNAATFGALNIYSAEPNTFTPGEVRLLEELTSDLAFGIDTLRTRAERKRSDEALQKTSGLLRTIIEAAPTAIIGLDLEGRVQAVWNPAAEKMLGWSAQEATGRFLPSVPEDKEEEFRRFREWVRNGKRLDGEEVRGRGRDGTPIDYSIYASPLHDPEGRIIGNIAVLVDITERKRTEEEQERLQAQFLQAQKMESVGRLAGGVAHDFNNMLGVILGHTEVALAQLDPTQPLFVNMEGILKATERSIDLTRQLLAFARKQTIAPQVLDLNDTVEGMLKILRRLIGEDIDLTWLPGAGGWPVKVDPSQIDQILANLCVNARDAISGVGNITIETHTAIFDEADCTGDPGFFPGEYMLLAVSDNGCGMDKVTMDKLFEPFFTTKEKGKGTGLGLATVYGIVKQNDGFINVYSEPDKGTTFKIYLPRHAGQSEQIKEKKPAASAARGDETILLVEDEPDMLRMITMILDRLGYNVLAAKTPGEAIRLAEEHAGRIHLLMTDVVMPEMNGRDLTNKMLSRYPDLKGLFMSGYTADVIAHHGILEEGVHFIQKPFSIKDLATKVREVLGSR